MSSYVSHYHGLASNRNRRDKYANCEHSKLRGKTVRLLMPAEILEFRKHIAQVVERRLLLLQSRVWGVR